MEKNQGFSLIELIVVIALIAVLTGVLAPQYLKYVEKAKLSTDEDTADVLVSAGYLMVSDEEYNQGISDGDQIIFSASGISVQSAGTTIEDGLDEYASGWRNKKVGSKTYKGQQYIIEFTFTANSTFHVKGGWQP